MPLLHISDADVDSLLTLQQFNKFARIAVPEMVGIEDFGFMNFAASATCSGVMVYGRFMGKKRNIDILKALISGTFSVSPATNTRLSQMSVHSHCRYPSDGMVFRGYTQGRLRCRYLQLF